MRAFAAPFRPLPNSFEAFPDEISFFAVGAFAVATFLVGLRRAGYDGVSAGRARRWPARSQHSCRSDMSTFLKIFEAIFAIETIVFGLAFLIDDLGFGRRPMQTYTLPDSLPLRCRAVRHPRLRVSSHSGRAQNGGDRRSLFQCDDCRPRARIWPFPPFVDRAEQARGDRAGVSVLINQVEVAITVRLSYFRARLHQRPEDQGPAGILAPDDLRLRAVRRDLCVAAYMIEYRRHLDFRLSAGGAGCRPIISGAG